MANLSYAETRKITNIVRQFELEGTQIDMIQPFGGGRINHTYLITFRSAGGTRYEYLLQNVNSNVFPEPEKLMENVISVTNFIKNSGGKQLTFIKCIENVTNGKSAGPYLYVDSDGKYWRMYHYIEADVYPCIINPYHARMLGDAIAKFSTFLDGFDANKLWETIPDFHNTPKRFEALLLSIIHDFLKGNSRAESAKDEIQFVVDRKDKLGFIMIALNKGLIPYRVAHNDPKLSNVLFSKENAEPICMIDLDTIMKGSGLSDVGDALRSIANTASEDDITTKNVSFSLEIYKEFISGYIKAMGDKLSKHEIELIPYSPYVITLELGIRFLKDHIDGNTYFKVDYDNQNLERARIQFALAADIECKMDEMNKILHDVVNEK